MPGFNLSQAAPILKNLYLPPVRELLNNSTVLLKYLEKEVQDVEGTNFTIPLHVSRNSAAGIGIAENGTLPAAGSQGYTTAIVPAKYLYSRIRVSGPTIAASKSNKGSFLRALDAEMKGVTKDTRRSFNRQLHGDGTDYLAKWVSTTDGTHAIFNDGLGNAGYDFMPSGALQVDVVESDNATLRYTNVSATRQTLGATGRTFLFAATAGMASGDYLVNTGTLGQQMTGIQAVIANTDPALLAGGLHGITVAAQPDWVAQWLSADGGTTEPTTSATRKDLSFVLMQQIFSMIATNSDFSEQDIKLLLCSYQMRDTYVKLCQDERKFYNTMKLDGGFEAVSYNGKPLVPDVHCRHNRINFITPESMALFRLADLDWINLQVSPTVH